MYAPFDGIIGQKFIDVGNLVGGADQTTLANIVVLNPIYVEFSPSVSDFSDFLKYQDEMPFDVKVVMPHNEKEIFNGKIDLINNQANINTSTILMRANVQNPKSYLLPGIYVNVRVILKHHSKALLVPAEAILESQGQRFVYVLGKGNKVVSQNIKVANEYKQQYVVTSGLNAGDIIITDGLQKIRPGMVVKPTKDTAQKESNEKKSDSADSSKKKDQAMSSKADADTQASQDEKKDKSNNQSMKSNGDDVSNKDKKTDKKNHNDEV